MLKTNLIRCTFLDGYFTFSAVGMLKKGYMTKPRRKIYFWGKCDFKSVEDFEFYFHKEMNQLFCYLEISDNDISELKKHFISLVSEHFKTINT